MSFGLLEKCPHPATSFFDRTGDGGVTITDIWLLLGDILYFPGEFIISMMANKPGLVSFFELTCKSPEGTTSLIISLFVWLFFFTGLASANK